MSLKSPEFLVTKQAFVQIAVAAKIASGSLILRFLRKEIASSSTSVVMKIDSNCEVIL